MASGTDRRGWVALGAIALVVAAAGGVYAWTVAEEDARIAARERARAERDAEREEREQRVAEESSRLMPDILHGISLGMTREQVRALRPRLTPSARTQDHPLSMMEERLPNGGTVMYGFARREPQQLVQVQILSLLPSTSAIAPHLAAMHEQYGRPTGIWDCPTTGNVPTRRFTWRSSYTTVSDVFLLYGDRVSLTLYIATTEQIGRSLAMASCVPVTPDRIDTFPVATAEQLQAVQGVQGAP